jgi:type I restriction enzyme S subunit
MNAVLKAQEPRAQYLAHPERTLTRGFDLLATAIGGVPKLRELIRSMAVRGLLIPQSPDDAPARELLADIRKAKERLIADRRLRPDKGIERVAEDDRPFAIPSSWAWARFGSIVINRDGERVPVSSEDRQHRAKVFDYYGASGVIDKIDGYLFDKTLLLIGEDGANLINRSTPIAFLALGKYWVNNHAHVIDATHDGLMEYLCLFINAISLESYITGTAQPKMNQAKLNSIPVALPPLAEQHRIVARVEELMKLCDSLEQSGQLADEQHARLTSTLFNALAASESAHALAENWQRVAEYFDLLLDRPEAVDAFEQTIDQLAVRGLLVQQDREADSGSSLLVRFQQAGSESGKRAKAELVPLGADDIPFSTPEVWAWARLGDVVDVTGGVTLGRKGALANPLTLPYLRVANVQRGHLNLATEVKTVSIDAAELSRFQLKAGDLLITEGGDWDKVGRTCIWRSEIPTCLHQNHIFRARGRTAEWSPEWGQLYLNSADARAYFASSAKQTTNLASINMMQLRHCALPLPPLAEQHRIVARVEELRQRCADLRRRLTQAQEVQSSLADALAAEVA